MILILNAVTLTNKDWRLQDFQYGITYDVCEWSSVEDEHGIPEAEKDFVLYITVKACLHVTFGSPEAIYIHLSH